MFIIISKKSYQYISVVCMLKINRKRSVRCAFLVYSWTGSMDARVVDSDLTGSEISYNLGS
jgi:hypothetical protein